MKVRVRLQMQVLTRCFLSFVLGLVCVGEIDGSVSVLLRCALMRELCLVFMIWEVCFWRLVVALVCLSDQCLNGAICLVVWA